MWSIGSESSVWPGAVLRGDFGNITVGAGSSIQDGTVIHAGPGFPTLIGDGCVVGHLTHLEGCILEDESLAGSGSVVLHWAVISRGATVGANAVVPNNMIVPPGALALGRAGEDLRGPLRRADDPAVGRRVRRATPSATGLRCAGWTEAYFVVSRSCAELGGNTSVPKGARPVAAANPRWPSPSVPPVVSPRRSS